MHVLIILTACVFFAVIFMIIYKNDKNYCIHCKEYDSNDFLDGKCPVCRRKLP